MSRRLKQWGELSQIGRGWGAKEYIYRGPKLPGWDGVHINIPSECLQWKKCWLYVWTNDRLIHKECVSMDIFNRTYYTLRQENVPDHTNIKILLEQI